jgi:hypothetical protein
MGLISFIKNLFKQKEDDLWVDPKSNSKSFITIGKCDNHILEINTLTGEIIIKGNSREYHPHEYWFPQK